MLTKEKVFTETPPGQDFKHHSNFDDKSQISTRKNSSSKFVQEKILDYTNLWTIRKVKI